MSGRYLLTPPRRALAVDISWDLGCFGLLDQLRTVLSHDEASGNQIGHAPPDCPHIGCAIGVETLEPLAVKAISCPAIKQNDAPVELPVQVLVGTSTYGERTPPFTLPYSSSTGLPFSTAMGSARGGAVPLRTHSSRFRKAALNATLLGKRLRGPSLQSIGGTGMPALVMSAEAAANVSSSGVA